MDKLDDYFSMLIAAIAVIYSFLSIIKSMKRPAPRDEDEEFEKVAMHRQIKNAPPAPPVYYVEPPEKKVEPHSNLEPDIHAIDALRFGDSVVTRAKKRATISDLVKSLPQEKMLFISYEVFHVPVSRRPSPFPWNG